MQVRAMQSMGATAVIVGSRDHESDLLTMTSTDDTSDIVIPSVYMLYVRRTRAPGRPHAFTLRRADDPSPTRRERERERASSSSSSWGPCYRANDFTEIRLGAEEAFWLYPSFMVRHSQRPMAPASLSSTRKPLMCAV